MAESAVAALLKFSMIGRDSFDVAVIREAPNNKVNDYGLACMTISDNRRIDAALRNIIGRASGKPTQKLIDGAFRTGRIPYATGLHFTDMSCLT